MRHGLTSAGMTSVARGSRQRPGRRLVPPRGCLDARRGLSHGPLSVWPSTSTSFRPEAGMSSARGAPPLRPNLTRQAPRPVGAPPTSGPAGSDTGSPHAHYSTRARARPRRRGARPRADHVPLHPPAASVPGPCSETARRPDSRGGRLAPSVGCLRTQPLARECRCREAQGQRSAGQWMARERRMLVQHAA